MNFSGISNKAILGKVLRLPLKFLPTTLQVPIIQGKLRGKKWIVGSSTHGCWLGSYEFQEQKLIELFVKEGDIFFDLGGHVGFYTLLASVLVGPEGKVVTFEPSPRNIGYLREHLRLNHISNVSVIEAAVSDKGGIVHFDIGQNSSMGHVADVGNCEVKSICLDDLINMNEIPVPNCMKIDIEGAELLALSGAKSLLTKWHPSIFLSTHGHAVHSACCSFLTEFGYNLIPIDEQELNRSTDILAIHRSEKT